MGTWLSCEKIGGESRDPDPGPEDAASQGLAKASGGIQITAGSGDPQIVRLAKAAGRHGFHRQPDFGQPRSGSGIMAGDAAAAPQGNPQAP